MYSPSVWAAPTLSVAMNVSPGASGGVAVHVDDRDIGALAAFTGTPAAVAPAGM